jgi:predicted DNA binding CopG/RHH family protein
MQLHDMRPLNVRIPQALLVRVKQHAAVTGQQLRVLVTEVLDKAMPTYKKMK